MALEASLEQKERTYDAGAMLSKTGQPAPAVTGAQHMPSELAEIVTFLLAVLGAIALGLGITEYLSDRPYVFAYLLAYAGFRIADAFAKLPPDLARARHRHVHERMGHLPLLLFFAAAPFERTYLYGGDTPDGLAAIGFILELAGLWIGLGARIQLGRVANMEPGASSSQAMIRTGFYRYIRHPIYAGDFLVLLMWPLEYAAPITGLMTLWYGFRSLRERMKLEESILLDRFGEDYAAYVKSTDRLIPGVY